MTREISSPVVLVTGASSGIGAAVARRFAAAGARLILAARRADRLRALAAELAVPAHVVALDVRDRAAVARAVAEIPEGFAAIDVLVNNAGGALGLEPAPEADLDDWETMVDTNCKGLMYVTRAVLPGMVETEFSQVRFKGDEARARAVYQGFPPLRAEDVAEAVFWCATLPEHVNVNRIELMSVMQSFAGFSVKRSS